MEKDAHVTRQNRLSAGFRNATKKIERFDFRMMRLAIISPGHTIHFVTVYAPRPHVEKGDFWELLDIKIGDMIVDDYLVIMSVKRQTVTDFMMEIVLT